jgi:hypothetical protein
MAILHGLLSRRPVPRPVPPFTLPPLHRLIHHPVRRHEEPAPASRLAARAAKPLHSSPRAPADPTPGPSRVGAHQEVSTGPRAGTIRSFGDEPLHFNSRHPKIAKALVRTRVPYPVRSLPGSSTIDSRAPKCDETALHSSQVLKCKAGIRFGLRPRSGSGNTMRGARRRRFSR